MAKGLTGTAPYEAKRFHRAGPPAPPDLSRPSRGPPPGAPAPAATAGWASPRSRTPVSWRNCVMMRLRSGAKVWWFPTNRMGRPSGTLPRPRTMAPCASVL